MMAAPGTITHVLEVAAQLQAATAAHAASIVEAASAATDHPSTAAEAPPADPPAY
jgi:hypothetical protein